MVVAAKENLRFFPPPDIGSVVNRSRRRRDGTEDQQDPPGV
jgi:hypothetical protein